MAASQKMCSRNLRLKQQGSKALILCGVILEWHVGGEKFIFIEYRDYMHVLMSVSDLIRAMT